LSSEEVLLNEVRSRYNVELNSRNTLDQTAANMLLIIGASIGFLMTLSAALLVKIQNYPFLEHLYFVLIAGIILSIAAIISFLFVRKETKYTVVIGIESVLESTLPSAESIISSVISYDIENLRNKLIKAYLKSIHGNYEVNKKKNKIIDLGEVLFVLSITLIMISVILQLHALMQATSH
jgi:hypothetical protein